MRYGRITNQIPKLKRKGLPNILDDRWMDREIDNNNP